MGFPSSDNMIGPTLISTQREACSKVNRSSATFEYAEINRLLKRCLTPCERCCACVLGVSDCEYTFIESVYCEFLLIRVQFQEKIPHTQCATFDFHIEYYRRGPILYENRTGHIAYVAFFLGLGALLLRTRNKLIL